MLNEILDNAINNVNFYRKNVLCTNGKKLTIQDFPIVERKNIQINFKDFLNSSIQNVNILETSSSGSSGNPLSVYWVNNDYMKSMYTLWKRRSKYYGITPYSKKIDFTYETLDATKWYSITENSISVSRMIIDDHNKLEELFDLMNKFMVEWMYIQPYVAKKIIDYIIKYNAIVPKSIKYIESVGEILSEEIRVLLYKVFKCPVANMYGSEEMNGIAYECPYHNMHILMDNVYLETEYKNEGNVYITNLHNYLMPFIRYKQGDVISMTAGKNCPCGSNEPIIETILGRSYEQIKINNHLVNPYVLITIVEKINSSVENIIRNYKFVFDKSTENLTVMLSIENNNKMFEKIIKQALIEELQNWGFDRSKIIVKFFEKILLKTKKNSVLEII